MLRRGDYAARRREPDEDAAPRLAYGVGERLGVRPGPLVHEDDERDRRRGGAIPVLEDVPLRDSAPEERPRVLAADEDVEQPVRRAAAAVVAHVDYDAVAPVALREDGVRECPGAEAVHAVDCYVAEVALLVHAASNGLDLCLSQELAGLVEVEGVDEEELWRDWEVTAFQKEKLDFGHRTRFSKLVKVFDAFPGANINEKIVAYVKSAGFTDADIEKFRAIMLEP